MMDVYYKMCKSSPVQDEWKPKMGDTFIDSDGFSFIIPPREPGFLWKPKNLNVTWLPRQEDWELMCAKASDGKLIYPPDGMDLFYSVWCEIQENYAVPCKFPECYPKIITMLWCLYAHRDVFNLDWDWDEKRWIEV